MQPQGDVRAGRGWLSALALAHMGFLLASLSALLEISHRLSVVDHPMWLRRPTVYMYEEMVRVQTREAFGRMCILAVGIRLLPMLLRRDLRLPRLYLGYGIAFVVLEVIQHRAYLSAGAAFIEAGFVSYRAKSAVRAALVLTGVVLANASPARRAFVRSPVEAGPARRLGIGLAAAALILWPFVMTACTDGSTWVSGLFSPRYTTAGEPATWAVLAVSVGGGLLILMKDLWRMRNLWIAILWPISFAILAVVFDAIEFDLHYRF